MKRLIFFFSMIVPFITEGQQRYLMAPSSGTFTPLVGGTAVDAIENDQGLSEALPLNFSFNFFGLSFTTVQATAEGFLTFNGLGGATVPITDNNLNAGGNYLRLIAPLWDDLNGDGGSASYATTGAAGNRIFTFEWLNWKWNWSAASAGISFQVKLYENGNVVEFVYRQEPGTLNSPSASCGLVGLSSAQFYSLTDFSGTPQLAAAPVNTLNAKPETGHTFTFTPDATPVSAPASAPTNVIMSNVGGTSATASWTNGSGSYTAVFVKQTSNIETASLNANTYYAPSTSFGQGSTAGTGWYCVYNGTGTSVVITNLQAGPTYRVHAVSYNGLAATQKYKTDASGQNPISFSIPALAPTGAVTTITPLWIKSSEISIAFSLGNGTGRAIFVKEANTGTAPVVDNTTYVANSTFGAGSQIGSSGWFCVYNAVAPGTLTISGLTPNKEYSIHIVSYNGAPGFEKYNTTTGGFNPFTPRTLESHAVPVYDFAASSGNFVPLTGATSVSTILGDDAFSQTIPIGFSFRLAATPFTQLIASSNGFLSFNNWASNNGAGFSNGLINSPMRPLIAPLWDDLSGQGGQASYKTEGQEPNRVFTFEWLNWRWGYSAAAPGISFQVKLYEFDNKIEYIYKQEAGALASPSASVGLAFVNTGNGNYLSLNNLSASPVPSSTTETTDLSLKPADAQVYTFTPQKNNQSITFPPISDKFYGTTAFVTSASATSGLPLTYETSNSAVATVSNNQITVIGTGSVTITAYQSGNNAYNAAPAVERSFIVNKANQIINYNSNTMALTFGDNSNTHTLNIGTTSGLPVQFESDNEAIATTNGNTITVVSSGSANITMTQPGNTNYNPAPSKVVALTVNKGNQQISFSNLVGKVATDSPFSLNASTNSGLTITYESSNTAVATIQGNTVTIVGAGTTDISANQTGNSNWNAATPVSRSLAVSKAPQQIDFPSISDKTFGDAAFELTVSSNSGLPLTLLSSNPQVASVSGKVITIHKAGSVSITASTDGNNVYSPASLSRTLYIAKASQVITFTPVPKKSITDEPFILQASASSGLPVTFSAGNFFGIIEINGNTAKLLQPGIPSITAQQIGNENYVGASASVSFCVKPARPEIMATIESEQSVKLSLKDPNFNYTTVWYRNNQEVSQGNEISTSQIPGLGVGSYTVKIAVGPDCESELSLPMELLITSAFADSYPKEHEQAVQAFPNPVIDQLELILPVRGAEIRILNSVGATLLKQSTTGSTKIDMSGLPSGIYTAQIKLTYGIVTRKIVKK
ncbi:MAG TPA: T9SS type A sorting domain-containing protein [Chryseosolibacter sp.]